jgi:integrase
LKSLKIDGAAGDQAGRRSFTLAEVQLLYSKAPTDFWRYMVLAGFYTGQRLGDLISVTWSGVDLETMTLHLVAQKTGKSMHIPIRGALGGLLKALASEGGTKRPKGPIWPAEQERYEKGGAGPFSNAFYDLMLVPAGLAAPRTHHAKKSGGGITRQASAVSFHCLRHTFVSMIKLSGGSQAVAKELAGHSSDQVSDLYTHCPPESLKSAIDLLPEVAV